MALPCVTTCHVACQVPQLAGRRLYTVCLSILKIGTWWGPGAADLSQQMVVQWHASIHQELPLHHALAAPALGSATAMNCS